ESFAPELASAAKLRPSQRTPSEPSNDPHIVPGSPVFPLGAYRRIEREEFVDQLLAGRCVIQCDRPALEANLQSPTVLALHSHWGPDCPKLPDILCIYDRHAKRTPHHYGAVP